MDELQSIEDPGNGEAQILRKPMGFLLSLLLSLDEIDSATCKVFGAVQL